MPRTTTKSLPDEATALVPEGKIVSSILAVRGQRVMLDQDLAELYGVRTAELTRAVKRHAERFPDDFAFQLTDEEFAALRYQIGTSKGRGGRRYAPYVFTEQGVAMLSSVLNSSRAVQVNIEIMRAFVRLRGLIAGVEQLAERIDELEQRYDAQFASVFEAIRELMRPPAVPAAPGRRLGFETGAGAA